MRKNEGAFRPIFVFIVVKHAPSRNNHVRSIAILGFLGLLFLFAVPALAAPKGPREGRLSGASVRSITTEEFSVAEGDLVPEIQSVELVPEFPLNGLLARWPEALPIDETLLQLEVRVAANGTWTDWMALAPLHDAPTDFNENGTSVFSEPVFLNQADRMQYRLRGELSAAALRHFNDIEIIYIDSRTKRTPLSWAQRLFTLRRATAGEGVPILRRQDWGADESYRLAADGSERWQRTYAPAEKVILHHTAGSNGGDDPTAVIRGIYYFHAVILGWGDIGYNYLIDPAGRIYEGRFGGDGVVGGHTYNDQEKVDYNRGTIGIAFLGNFEGEVLTDAARGSATALMAEKGQLFGFSPIGSGPFRNRADLPTIVGHRDVDATLCPGANVHNQLEIVRGETQTKLAALPPAASPLFAATLLSSSTQSLRLEAGVTTTVNVEYTNTSTIAWRSYLPPQRMTLRPVNGESALTASSWESPSVVGASAAANVAVNETATFPIAVTAPTNALAVRETFALFMPDGTEAPGTRVELAVEVTNLSFAGIIETLPIPPASFLEATQTFAVTIRNVGNRAWDANTVALRVYDPDDKPSAYRASSWHDPYGTFRISNTLNSGDTVILRVPLRTPRAPGIYRQSFRLERLDEGDLVTDERIVVTRADSRLQARFLGAKLPLAVRASWRPTLTVQFKNTGVAPWTRKMTLEVLDVGGTTSRFLHPAWRTQKANAALKEKVVRPGEVGTFVVRLKPPQETGVYRQVFRLSLPGAIVQQGAAEILTRVDS